MHDLLTTPLGTAEWWHIWTPLAVTAWHLGDRLARLLHL